MYVNMIFFDESYWFTPEAECQSVSHFSRKVMAELKSEAGQS